MDFVSDTNIFLAVVLDEPEKDNIIQLSLNGNALSPEILPYEIGNALTAMVKRRQLSQDEALSAYEAANAIPVRLISIDIRRALNLAFKYRIYTYDAYFLECARYMSCPLMTLDTRMKQVATELKIEILE